MAAARRSALLAYCRSLPRATEDIKWGNDLIFSVGDKMFAGFSNTGKDATFGCTVPAEDFDPAEAAAPDRRHRALGKAEGEEALTQLTDFLARIVSLMTTSSRIRSFGLPA